MGDERVDELNLPLSHQSGNVDVGHLSALASKITADQSLEVSDLLTQYYSNENNIGFNELQSQLDGLGYSHERIEEISLSAHEERIYRTQNGHPSDLSPNQLLFLHSQGNMNLHGANIFTTADGRQYITDSRVREEDGTPSRLFLPNPEPFDPLTASQRVEVDYLGSVRSDITLTADSTTGEEVSLTEDQRIQFNRLLTTYLNSDPANRQYQRVLFRTNIQNIPNISQVTDIRNILFDFMVDSDSEYDFRQSNDGLPQNLSIEQLNFLRENQNQYHYMGQPILTGEDGTLFFYGTNGKLPVPRDADIELIQNQPTFNDYDIRPTQADTNALNVALADFVSGATNQEQFEREVRGISNYDPEDPARDPFRADFYNSFIHSLVIANQEREFREINNGRPSQLSQLQYDYLINHPLQDGEERYYGQILTEDRGVARYQLSNGDVMLIPSDDIINQQIDNGVYNPVLDIQGEPITDADLRGNVPVIPNRPILPSIDDQLDITSGSIEFDPDNPLNEPLKPPEIPIILDPNNPLILPDNIILPDELPSGEFYNDPYTQEYVRYVDNYSNLYAGFREQFSNYFFEGTGILVGGAIGYSFGIVRNRMIFSNALSEMEKTLLLFDNQLETLEDTRSQVVQAVEDNVEYANEHVAELTAELGEENEEITSGGYAIFNELNRLRGLLAGTEDDPDMDADILREDIYGSGGLARTLADNNQRLNDLRSEITDIQEIRETISEEIEEIDTLTEELSNLKTTRTEINTQFTTTTNKFYSTLFEISKYQKEISIGATTGGVIGKTLSLILQGYYQPTAITNELDIPIPDNIKKENKQKKIKNPIKKPINESKENTKNPFNIQQGQEYKMIESKSNNNNKFKVKNNLKENVFRPTKNSGAYPLTLEQINDFKSTLQPDELKRLQGNMLIFGTEGQIEKVKDHCKSVQNPIQFTRKSISKR